MRNQFDANGRWKHHESLRARRLALWDSLRTKHSAEFSHAGLWGKIALRWRMHRELRREWKEIAPPPHVLYAGAPSHCR